MNEPWVLTLRRRLRLKNRDQFWGKLDTKCLPATNFEPGGREICVVIQPLKHHPGADGKGARLRDDREREARQPRHAERDVTPCVPTRASAAAFTRCSSGRSHPPVEEHSYVWPLSVLTNAKRTVAFTIVFALSPRTEPRPRR